MRNERHALQPALHPRAGSRNGLTVLVLERRHLPIVSATLLIRAGSRSSRRIGSRCGASSSRSFFPLGTTRRGAIELAEDVDGLGASLSVGCDFDYATVDVTGAPATPAALIDILAEVALEPAFLDEEIERKRSQILGLPRKAARTITPCRAQRFFEAIYGAHPYHRTKEGTPESVASDGRGTRSRTFHGARYAPGRLDPGAGRRHRRGRDAGFRAPRRFGGWERRPLPCRRAADARAPGARGRHDPARCHPGDDPDGQHRASSATIPTTTPPSCMNYILGGSGFGSRLMKNLREERGLTYGVHSNFWPRREPGYFFAATQTKVETMNEAIARDARRDRTIPRSGATEEELAWAKKFFTGSLPLTLETNDQIAGEAARAGVLRAARRVLAARLEQMQAVTREQVIDVARRHIHPDRFAIVVLADFREHPLRSDLIAAAPPASP